MVNVDIEEGSWCLGDGDLARLGLLVLRNDNAEQTVLHGGCDIVLVDASWERERARELSNTALRDPELRFRFLGASGLGLLGNFGGSAFCTFVLDGSLVGLVTIGTLDGTSSWSTFDEASGRGTGLIRALGATLDGDGVVIAELDLDVLLLDTGEFAVQLIVVLDLLDVELGVEGLHLAAVTTATSVALRVLVEVLEKLEEWVEGGVGGGETWEVVERHLSDRCL